MLQLHVPLSKTGSCGRVGASRVHSVRCFHDPLPPPLIRGAINVPLHPHQTNVFLKMLARLQTCAAGNSLTSSNAGSWKPCLAEWPQAYAAAASSVRGASRVTRCNATHQVETHTQKSRAPATRCIPEMQFARALEGGQLHASSSSCAKAASTSNMLRQPQGMIEERDRRGRVGTTNVTSPAGTLGSPVTFTANLRSCACAGV